MSSAVTERAFLKVTDLNVGRLLDSTIVYKCKGTSKKGTEEDLSRDKKAVERQKPGAVHTSFGDGGRSLRR